ncbi:MAG: tail fiber domain-containing protein, partial [Chitinophagaceae bacterium]|nr:tail fiber domain-containing protein [Chitinophagaceae bacterium]
MTLSFRMKQMLFTLCSFCALQILQAQVNNRLSNLASQTTINVTLQPAVNNSIDIGSPLITWRNIYAGQGYYVGKNKVLHFTGTGNSFIGINSGENNTTGISNAATGFSALTSNTIGNSNTAVGAQAMFNNVNVSNNTAIGYQALFNQAGLGDLTSVRNTDNTAIGYRSLFTNGINGAEGAYNTSVGANAMKMNTTGSLNVAVGNYALQNNVGGNYNTAVGTLALANNTSSQNIAFGSSALTRNSTGFANSAIGASALNMNEVGSHNTAAGYSALYWNRNNYNTGFGYRALFSTTNAQYNTAIGYNAGAHYDLGYNNTLLGANTGVNQNGLYNVIAIGQDVYATASSQARIGNAATNSIGGYANWSNVSDGRIKRNMKSNVPGLAFINALSPVTYTLSLDEADRIMQVGMRTDADGKVIDKTKEEQLARKAKEQVTYSGFVAQDVEKAAKQMGYEFSGVDAAKNEKDLYGLRYAEFVVPLVKAVQELSAENEELKRRLNKLEEKINGKPIAIARLDQSTPNPANGAVNIGYYIPVDTQSAVLIITNTAGQRIKTLQLNNEGYGNATINSQELSAG